MNNLEIYSTLESRSITVRRYVGVFLADTLPEISPGQCLVANTDLSSQPGKHWILIYKEADALQYFDQLGEALPEGTMKDYFRDKSYEFNNKKVQNSDSESCSFFLCILPVLQVDGLQHDKHSGLSLNG